MENNRRSDLSSISKVFKQLGGSSLLLAAWRAGFAAIHSPQKQSTMGSGEELRALQRSAKVTVCQELKSFWLIETVLEIAGTAEDVQYVQCLYQNGGRRHRETS